MQFYFSSTALSAITKANGGVFGAVSVDVRPVDGGNGRLSLLDIFSDSGNASVYAVRVASGFVFCPAVVGLEKLVEWSQQQGKFLMFVGGKRILGARDVVLEIVAAADLGATCPHCGGILPKTVG